jgi:phage repressor protein C with HTH and peptisase S24 domain
MIENWNQVKSITEPTFVSETQQLTSSIEFRHYGKSMEPLIDAGAILFATKDESWQDYIEYGQIYGIVCNNKRRFLKYIQKSEKAGHILLRSENKEFESFDLPISTIKSIWLVHGWATKRV